MESWIGGLEIGGFQVLKADRMNLGCLGLKRCIFSVLVLRCTKPKPPRSTKSEQPGAQTPAKSCHRWEVAQVWDAILLPQLPQDKIEELLLFFIVSVFCSFECASLLSSILDLMVKVSVPELVLAVVIMVPAPVVVVVVFAVVVSSPPPRRPRRRRRRRLRRSSGGES